MMPRNLVVALVVLTSVGMLVIGVSSARADKPAPCPIGSCLNGPASYAAGEVCPFPVRIVPSGSNVVHTLPNGDLVFTGHLVQTVTNLRTGQTVVMPSSGPLRLVFNQDGGLTLIGHGLELWAFLPQDVGGPGLVISKDRVVIRTNSDGFAVSVGRMPNRTDICQALTG